MKATDASATTSWPMCSQEAGQALLRRLALRPSFSARLFDPKRATRSKQGTRGELAAAPLVANLKTRAGSRRPTAAVSPRIRAKEGRGASALLSNLPGLPSCPTAACSACPGFMKPRCSWSTVAASPRPRAVWCAPGEWSVSGRTVDTLFPVCLSRSSRQTSYGESRQPETRGRWRQEL